jgi:hypothetical protein
MIRRCGTDPHLNIARPRQIRRRSHHDIDPRLRVSRNISRVNAAGNRDDRP